MSINTDYNLRVKKNKKDTEKIFIIPIKFINNKEYIKIIQILLKEDTIMSIPKTNENNYFCVDEFCKNIYTNYKIIEFTENTFIIFLNSEFKILDYMKNEYLLKSQYAFKSYFFIHDKTHKIWSYKLYEDIKKNEINSQILDKKIKINEDNFFCIKDFYLKYNELNKIENI